MIIGLDFCWFTTGLLFWFIIGLCYGWIILVCDFELINFEDVYFALDWIISGFLGVCTIFIDVFDPFIGWFLGWFDVSTLFYGDKGLGYHLAGGW